jgi:pimeloyl-ACP methyl ester carboxylesterase
MLAVGNRWLLRRVLRRGGPAHNDTELAAYLAAFAGPGAMTAALNYYRALFRVRSQRPVTIACPTLLIWGLRDRFLLPALADGTEAWVPTLERHEEPRARHWVQHDASASVNARLLEFLSHHAAS